MKNIAILIALMLVVGVGPALALDAPIDEGLAKAADSKSYVTKVPGMIAHGAYEMVEAPLEPLYQPYNETIEKKDYKLGFFKGLNQGVFNALEGLTRGLFNVIRSLAPGVGRYEKTDHQTRVL